MSISQKKPVNALEIPSKERVTGLEIHCNFCKGQPNDGVCKLKCNGKNVGGKCKHPEEHRYRLRLHIPGTKNGKEVKTLKARKLGDAIVEAIQLKKEFKEKGSIHTVVQSNQDQSLAGRVVQYIDEINPENNKITNVTKVSIGRVKDVSRNFKFFADVLSENRIDITRILPEDITHEIAVIIATAVKEKKSNGFTQRNYITTYKRFYNYLRQTHNWNHKNEFSGGWNIEYPELVKEIITQEEFKKLLQTIDSGEKIGIDARGKKVFHGYSFINDALRIAMFTGCRRQEIVNMKYSHIKLDEENKKWYLEVPNIKGSKLSKKEKI